MKSIKRSLVLYFLALMAVALGAVGALIDHVAGRTLADLETASRQLIMVRYTDQIQAERSKFDAELIAQARLIANELQVNYAALGQAHLRKFLSDIRLAPLGALAVGLEPFPVHAALWSQIGAPQRRFNDPVARLNEQLMRVHFSRLELGQLPSVDDHGHDLVHVSVPAFPRGEREYRSRTLANETWETLIPAPDPANPQTESYSNRTLSDGTAVRVAGHRATMVVRLSSGRGFFDPNAGPRIGGTRPPEGPPPDLREPRESRSEFPPNAPPPAPSLEPLPVQFRFAYIQYGRPLAPLEAKIQWLDDQQRGEIALEAARTERDRFGLRATLGLIGSLTFLGLLFGGLLLVRRGLRPLDTLTNAVAQVNEKDFRLPVEPQQLSKELLPIHDRISQTLAQLKRAFEHDKQAVADISHELRTPVASLLATIDVCLRKPRDAEKYRQTLEDCRAITKQMGGLVERVMTLASLDAVPTAGRSAEVDGAGLVANVATVIRPLTQAHDLGFTVEVMPVTLHTDEDKLREVLLNLLHNAIEYNRPGGSIALSVMVEGPNAVFRVKDTGIGMTDEVRSRIFERFYRADASRTATGLHAGLGLAIVKECVDRLGGKIAVTSTPDVGSEFAVTLPLI